MTTKRRILHKLKLTEISGVDRPCQQGAVVTIMKRAPDEEVDALTARLAKLKAQLDANDATVEKFWSAASRSAARATARATQKKPTFVRHKNKKPATFLLTHARQVLARARGVNHGWARLTPTKA